MLYVLTSRCGTDMHEPKVFVDAATAHNRMKLEYEAIMTDYADGDTEYDEDGNVITEATCDFDHSCEDNYAFIDYGGEWSEWYVTECEVINSNEGD